MWLPFTPIASVAAGLLSSFQNPFNLGHKLNYTQLDIFTPHIEFARAAYCDPDKIFGWQCGGSSFLLRFYVFSDLLIGK
jgi:hypothetical protein